ncbi:MAG: hypothetical protein WCF80_00005, partial [Pseudolabrys sp.]
PAAGVLPLLDKTSSLVTLSVSAHIQSAMRYLNVTSNGRRWIANLHSNIFRAEHEPSLSGPHRRN